MEQVCLTSLERFGIGPPTLGKGLELAFTILGKYVALEKKRIGRSLSTLWKYVELAPLLWERFGTGLLSLTNMWYWPSFPKKSIWNWPYSIL